MPLEKPWLKLIKMTSIKMPQKMPKAVAMERLRFVRKE